MNDRSQLVVPRSRLREDAAFPLPAEVLRCALATSLGVPPPPVDRARRALVVVVEPAESVLGVRSGRRRASGRGTEDAGLVAHSLRRFLRDAVHGTPAALVGLYARDDHVWVTSEIGRELRDSRHWFLSEEVASRLLCAADHELWIATRRSARVPAPVGDRARPDWDPAAAGRALTLALLARGVVMSAELTLPLGPADAARVAALTGGDPSPDEAVAQVRALLHRVSAMLDGPRTAARPRADEAAIEAWAVDVHLRRWRW